MKPADRERQNILPAGVLFAPLLSRFQYQLVPCCLLLSCPWLRSLSASGKWKTFKNHLALRNSRDARSRAAQNSIMQQCTVFLVSLAVMQLLCLFLYYSGAHATAIWYRREVCNNAFLLLELVAIPRCLYRTPVTRRHIQVQTQKLLAGQQSEERAQKIKEVMVRASTENEASTTSTLRCLPCLLIGNHLVVNFCNASIVSTYEKQTSKDKTCICNQTRSSSGGG